MLTGKCTNLFSIISTSDMLLNYFSNSKRYLIGSPFKRKQRE